MLDNVREILSNPKYEGIEVDGKSLKELLSYVRIDKKTGKEVSYKDSVPGEIYMIQRFQLLGDKKQDEMFTALFGEDIPHEVIAQEYMSYFEKFNSDEEEEEYDA